MSNSSFDRRVVITGLGVVSPLGNHIDELWKNIVEGRCGIDRISLFDASAFDTQIAGEVKNFDPLPAFPGPKDVRRADRFSQFGVYAGWMALMDSGIDLDKVNRDEVGVFLGSGIGGSGNRIQNRQRIFLESKERSKSRPAEIELKYLVHAHDCNTNAGRALSLVPIDGSSRICSLHSPKTSSQRKHIGPSS